MDKTKPPLVSVIVPAYNVAEYIGDALNSVLAQTFTDHEIIVINDATARTSALQGGQVHMINRVEPKIVELVKRVGIQARTTNNIVERLHGTLKDRLRPMRGLKNEKSSKILLDGYVVNYNYVRKHQTIKKTPAQAAGIQITNGWSELIDKATQDQALEHDSERKPEEQVIEVKA